MLAKKSCLVAILALGSLFAVASSERDTNDYCRDMRDEMRINGNHYPSAKAAFEGMQLRLVWTPIVFFGLRPKLTKAWEAVLDGVCDENSAEHARVTASCHAEQFEKVALMGEAVKKYVEKCLTPSFWDEQLENLIGAEDQSGLKSFLSDEFIADYHRENQLDEREIHAGVGGSENCCQPDHAHGALLKALEQSLGGVERVKENPERVKQVLEEKLFVPCERYVNAVDHLMYQAESISELREGDKEDFFTSLTPDFRNAIFRFKFCQPFMHLPVADLKFATINLEKLIERV